jgi:hypothetical protein
MQVFRWFARLKFWRSKMFYPSLTSRIKFYDLSRHFQDSTQASEDKLDIEGLRKELSEKFGVSPENIEINLKDRMSIIYYA